MRRRKFLTLLGSVAVAYPLAARAQQTIKRPTVALMLPTAPSSAAFAERLRELGWIEGRTVVIENRWTDGRPERVAEIAAQLVHEKVHVIVTYRAAVATLKQATTSIPIVLIANDPVGSGLVASLPGGNVTGLSLQAPESAGKRLELLRQLVPGLRRLAILFDAIYPAAVLEKDNVQAVARNLGFEVEPHGTRRVEDIAPVFDALKGQADALYVVANSANGARIATLALNMRLPTAFEHAVPVRAGGLMSYGPDLADLLRRAAGFVDKILRAAEPGELPIEQPTKFNLAINLKTAEALGLAARQLSRYMASPHHLSCSPLRTRSSNETDRCRIMAQSCRSAISAAWVTD
jgi:putative ABC transport system substrate-binding protein